MNVLEWKPADGCPACASAARLIPEHAKIASYGIGLAMVKIREQEAEIERQRAERDALKSENERLLDMIRALLSLAEDAVTHPNLEVAIIDARGILKKFSKEGIGDYE